MYDPKRLPLAAANDDACLAALSSVPVIAAWGMGVDSTAMIIEWVKQGLPLSAVLTADTGVEREETYAFLPIFQRWMDRHHIEHHVVRYVPKRFKHWPPYFSLLENCLTNATLPSISFGRHSCSLGPGRRGVFFTASLEQRRWSRPDDALTQRAGGGRPGSSSLSQAAEFSPIRFKVLLATCSQPLPGVSTSTKETVVKRALRLFLLLGALIGLFGQAVAYASVPPAVSAQTTMSGLADSGMSEDCMKMMAQQQQPTQKPCKGMTLACIAAMGCVVPMAVRNDAPALEARAADPTLAFWPTTTVLRGSELTPEPEPPTLLG